GKSQNKMANNVSLDFTCAGLDRVPARAQKAVGPVAAVDGVKRTLLECRLWSQNLLRHLLEALVVLAPEDFKNGTFRTWHSGGTDLRHRTQLVHAEILQLRVCLRQLLPHNRILAQRLPVSRACFGEGHQAVEHSSIDDRDACSQSRSLVHQRTQRDF